MKAGVAANFECRIWTRPGRSFRPVLRLATVVYRHAYASCRVYGEEIYSTQLHRKIWTPHRYSDIFLLSQRSVEMAMASEMKILLFGDQEFNRHTYLRTQLLGGRTSPLLASFFHRVNLALRREIAQLSPLEAKNIPAFSTIEELLDRTHSEPALHVGVESALLCISQLAHYIE